MNEIPQQILEQALRLPEGDRAAIATTLLNSLDPQEDLDSEEKWDAEIKRRLEEIDSGSAELVPLSSVRKRIDEIRNG